MAGELMPLVQGMASSHFPSLFQDTYRGWDRYWRILSGHVPQPPETEFEDEKRVAEWVARRNHAFSTLRESLTRHEIDALIVVAGDQDEWFSAAHLPNILIYAGQDPIKGFHNTGDMDVTPPLKFWEHVDRFGMTLEVDHVLAESILGSLVASDFDVSVCRKLSPQGRPERKAPHALTRPLKPLMANRQIPIVPVMIKTVERSPAVLNGARCIALGRAIAAACAAQEKRIAILASGGMSHDPAGPRSGWVDEPLDRWVIETLQADDMDALGNLFSFRSDTTDSGTGELRTWMVAAGAMSAVGNCGRKLVDYFPARKSTVGCGWFVWETR